ncbi:MAG: diguanylate cyclase [Nostocales cyanobacterium]|nr:MAG: diguanylate cyclase [Nostocales cyanobacterium]
MYIQYTHYAGLLGLTAFLSAIIGVITWQYPANPGRKSFTLVMFSVTGYALFAAFESASIILKDKIFWSKLEYLGSHSTVTFFLIFAIDFTYQKQWLTLPKLLAISIIPICNVILVATNEYHHLVWTGFLTHPYDQNKIIYQHGYGFFWIMIYVYLYTVTGIIIIAYQAAFGKSLLFRRQAIMLLIGSLAPLLGSTFYMLKLTPPGLNITPMCFIITGFSFLNNIIRFGMFDLIPVARDTLVENMRDGVLVLDLHNRIVDINPSAQKLLEITPLAISKYADKILMKWQQIVNLCYQNQDFTTEVLISKNPLAYVEARISPLRDRYGNLTGRLIILQDITKKYTAEIELKKANKNLKKQLHKIKALQAKLEKQANTDRLTGLFNRHYFDQVIPRQLAQGENFGYSVALIMMDIDYFKKINDTFGHRVGDLVLKLFAKNLQDNINNEVIAYRLGGEEFVIVLPKVNLETAYQIAEEIRIKFQLLNIKFEDKNISATVSGGIAMFPEHGINEDELLQVADQALYKAKAAGRNCIKLPETSK